MRSLILEHDNVTGFSILKFEDDNEVYGHYTTKGKAESAKRAYEAREDSILAEKAQIDAEIREESPELFEEADQEPSEDDVDVETRPEDPVDEQADPVPADSSSDSDGDVHEPELTESDEEAASTSSDDAE